jgi:hypothetical protein
MRTIIAGSRTITDQTEVDEAIKNSGFTITEVLSGGARGVDTLGEAWANAHSIPYSIFLADWQQHEKAAGPIRNSEMAANADALILVWDGASRGSQDMLTKAIARGLKIHVRLVRPEKE